MVKGHTKIELADKVNKQFQALTEVGCNIPELSVVANKLGVDTDAIRKKAYDWIWNKLIKRIEEALPKATEGQLKEAQRHIESTLATAKERDKQ